MQVRDGGTLILADAAMASLGHAHLIIGASGADRITGTKRNELIFGGVGVDFLNGNGGLDILAGGEGGDIYEVVWDGRALPVILEVANDNGRAWISERRVV